ncbi:MAG: HAMP domain-containing protein [Deltaproteobacteria bacterium]|nr:HAMP domain-containing protein [Deltaproteobacteria bacterium]
MRARVSIAAKFFLTYFVITGAALAFAGMAGYLQFRKYAMEEVDGNLQRQARLVSEMFRPLLEAPELDLGKIAREGDRVGKDLEIRLTIILPDGTVVGDSTVGASRLAGMENHADRPEVQAALSGKAGVSLRRSITVKEEERYLAIPILSGGRIVGVARTSIPVTLLSRRLGRIRAITWGTGFVAFLLMLAGTAIRAKHVTGPLKEMTAAARELASGNFGKRVHVKTGDELEELGAALDRTASRLEQTISQLEAGKARLATLLENLSEGVVVIADNRTIRMMNREAANILGTSGAPAEGRPVAEAIRHPDVLAYIDNWRRGETPAAREVFIPSRTVARTVRLSGTTVRYAEEQGSDLLLTLRDVTEEKRLARMKSDFVSNASHELRTPLTNIRGYLEAMEDAQKEGAPIDPSFLSIASANALRMDRLIEDLLELSRAESGQSPLEIEEIPLPAFLDRVAALHRPAAERAGKTLTVWGEDVALRADVRKLTLAVSNLLDNAIKYGGEGGRITLTGRTSEGSCLLEVADDGPGIPPEHLPRIFERFYRVDQGRSRDLGGTGLGLSIAKHIVESHRGTIRAESRLGVGTRFLIRIPG